MRRLFSGLLILALFAIPALAQDAPPSDTSGVTVTEIAQLDRRTGPGNTSAHLSPDGQRILHIDQVTFCILTVSGTEEGCYDLAQQTGLNIGQVAPDHDTVAWSPDGRFVAYTGDGWIRGRDMDIWLFAANTGQLTNLTDDGYDGSIFNTGDDIPDTAFIDYAPAWMPDGTLTFARNSASDPRQPAELWSLRLGDSEPVKVAELHPDADELGTVMSADWSADGSTLAYTLYHSGDQSGLWLYDAASGQTEFLLPDVREERGNAMRATFSPDASQILLLTSEREQFATDQIRDGHFVVSVETGEAVRLDPETWVMSAGWLPDGSGLIYTGRSAQFTEQGVYVSGDPAQAGRLALTGTIGEDEAPYNVYAPTNRVRSALKVSPDGTMLLGTSVAQALIVTRVEGFGPVPLQSQTAPEAQATDVPLMTDIPRVTVAPSMTETPVIDAGAQSAGAFTAVREVARLPISSIRNASSHLTPDGETLINAQGNVFCAYTLEGEENWCVEVVFNDGDEDRALPVDHDSVAMSDDGRYLAFTTDALRLFRDPDIWVLDLETQQVTNLTDDGYDGSMGSEDAPDTVHIDLAPAWRPDGMLTFARHAPSFNDAAPSLWAVDPAGGEPEKLADFEATVDAFNLVLDMDWSPDGSRMAYVLDSQSNPFGGLWLYEAANADVRPIVVPPEREGFLTAEFSPDGQSVLLQSMMHATARAIMRTIGNENNGYFVVSLDGSTQKLQSPLFIQNAGWLPDGSLLYLLFDQEERQNGGIFMASSASDIPEKVMELPTLEDRENAMLLGPTARQGPMIRVTANGRFVLGSPQDVTLVVEAYGDQTAQAASVPSAAETPAPETPAELGPVSVREVTRLDLLTGPAATSSRLLPDGETLIHAQMNEICAYTLAGAEQWCVEIVQHLGNDSGPVRVDPESITMSVDGRYLAFTSDALMTFRDPDIWVLDLQEQQYSNLTEDRYDGSMMLSDDIPDTAYFDLAPAWRPDGMLTFVRHTHDMRETIPSLWMVDPEGGAPEKLADFEGLPGNLNLVMSMDWSPDGSRMTFVLDNMSNPFGGLWLYEADKDNMKPLVIPPEDEPGFLRADFSPNGKSILLMTALREMGRSANLAQVPEQSGYFVVSADTGRVMPVQVNSVIMGIGWLPDSRLLYVGHVPIAPEDGGLFVVPAEGGESVKVMDVQQHEGEPLRTFSPTPRQWVPIEIGANGRFVLGTARSITPVFEAVTE